MRSDGQPWGHPTGHAAPGEFDLSQTESTYEGKIISDWFDYYLAGKGSKPNMSFEYFRPWVSYTGNAKPAFGSSAGYPAGMTA